MLRGFKFEHFQIFNLNQQYYRMPIVFLPLHQFIFRASLLYLNEKFCTCISVCSRTTTISIYYFFLRPLVCNLKAIVKLNFSLGGMDISILRGHSLLFIYETFIEYLQCAMHWTNEQYFMNNVSFLI